MATTDLGTATGYLDLDISGLTDGIANAFKSMSELETDTSSLSSKFSSIGDSLSSVGTKLTVGLTTPLVALGTVAVTTVADFESSMSQIQATMGLTSDSMSSLDGVMVNTMDALSDLAKELGSTTAFSASESAEAINYLALAGYDVQEIYSTLPSILSLASAGNFDLAKASDMVTDAMSALGLEVDYADTFVDQLAKTSSLTNTSVEQLGDAILTVGGTASTMTGGTEELATALGILANNGIKGSEGGTALRNVLLSLQTPTDQARAMLEELGVSVYDSEGEMRLLENVLGDLNESMTDMTSEQKTNIIGTIFNKSDLASVNALLSNTGDAWYDINDAIVDSAGSAEEMANTQLDNLSGQLTILKSSLEGLAISFGEIILPYISQAVEKIQALVEWFGNLDESTKENIIQWGLIIAAIGPVITIVGTLFTSISKIITVFTTIGTTISTVVTWFGTLSATFTTISTLCGTISTAFSTVISTIAGVVTPIGLVITALGLLWVAWETNFLGFRDLVENVIDSFKEFASDFTEYWGGVWDDVFDTVSNVFGATSDWIQSTLIDVGNFFIDVGETISDLWSNLWEMVSEIATSFATAIKDTLTSWFDGVTTLWNSAISNISTIWSGFWDVISTVTTTITTTISNIITSWFDNIKSIWDSAINVISTVWSAFWDTLSSVTSIISTAITNVLSSWFDNVKTTWNTFITNVNSIWDSFWNTIQSVATTITTAITNLFTTWFENVKNTWQTTFDAVSNIVTTVFNTIQTTITTILTTIKTLFDSWSSSFKSAWETGLNSVKSVIETVFNNIKDFISTTFTNIKTIASDGMTAVVSTVTGMGTTLYNAGKSVFTSLWDGFKSVFESISSWFSDVISTISGWFSNIWSMVSSGSSALSSANSATASAMTLASDGTSSYSNDNNSATTNNTTNEYVYNYTFNSPTAMSMSETQQAFESSQRDLIYGF